MSEVLGMMIFNERNGMLLFFLGQIENFMAEEIKKKEAVLKLYMRASHSSKFYHFFSPLQRSEKIQ